MKSSNVANQERKRIRKYSLIGLPVALFGYATMAHFRPLQSDSGGRDAGDPQLARNLPSDYPRVKFIDVTEQAGIRFEHFHGVRSTQLPEDMGSGAAWGDYDGDGYPDLYVVDVAGAP